MPRFEFTEESRRRILENNKAIVFNNGRTQIFITKQGELLEQIFFAIHLIHYLLKNRNSKFNSNSCGLGGHLAKQKAFQKLFFSTLNNISNDDINTYFPNYKHHPYLTLFLSFKELQKATPGRLPFVSDSINKYDKENKALEKLREGSKQDRFRTALDTFRRGPDENAKKLRDFFTQCSQIEDTLNFVRLDLYSQPGQMHPPFQEKTDLKVVKGNFKNLLDHIKIKLLKDTFVGHAWKLSASASTHFHYQLLIFCLPVNREVDSSIAEVIGKKWVQITGGVGVYFRHEGISLTRKPYEAGCFKWKENIDARARLRVLSNEVFINDYYLKPNLGRSFKSFGVSEVMDPRESAKDRKKRKEGIKLRIEHKNKKVHLSDMKLPLRLRKPSSVKRPKTTSPSNL